MPRSPLTVEKLSKDINFFEGVKAQVNIELVDTNVLTVANFISKYEQEDCNIVLNRQEQYEYIFDIYGNGAKQIRSLCAIMSTDIDVIELDLISIEEC